MTPQQGFGVAVRAFGLYSIVLGVSAAHSIIQIFGIRAMNNIDWRITGAFVALYFIGGFALLRRADVVVKFAYPNSETSN